MKTMLDFYKMTISAGLDLAKEVKANGTQVKVLFNKNTYRYNEIYSYNGDTYQIDSVLGIVDINDTAKDLDGVLFESTIKN